MGDEVLKDIERRRVEPLQIVEEQRKRVFLPREFRDEAPEHHLEAFLSLLWREVRNGRLFSDDELELGDEINDKRAVWTQRLLKAVPPSAKLRLTLPQYRADEALEGLRQGRIRNVALRLVEFAGRE